MKLLAKIALIVLATVAAAIGFFAWFAFGDHMETGFHRPSVDWLPPTASDVSFYRNSNIANVQAYEFRISRADFEALARERGWAIHPSGSSNKVTRYTAHLPKEHPQRQEPFVVQTDQGLFFEDRRENGGGITVLYNDAQSMAYVSKSSR